MTNLEHYSPECRALLSERGEGGGQVRVLIGRVCDDCQRVMGVWQTECLGCRRGDLRDVYEYREA